MKQDNMM